MKISIQEKKSKYKDYTVVLKKSELVMEDYDPKKPETKSACIYEGYLEEDSGPVTILGCPFSKQFEVCTYVLVL